MAKKVVVLTPADTLRSAKRRDADDIAELLAGELSEIKAACEGVAEGLEAIDVEQLEALAEGLDQLPATEELADAWRDAVATLQTVLLEIGEADNFTRYVEAYDNAEATLFEFIDLRDGDSYPGIGEERASAWDAAFEACEELAEAWEQVGERFVVPDTVTPPE